MKKILFLLIAVIMAFNLAAKESLTTEFAPQIDKLTTSYRLTEDGSMSYKNLGYVSLFNEKSGSFNGDLSTVNFKVNSAKVMDFIEKYKDLNFVNDMYQPVSELLLPIRLPVSNDEFIDSFVVNQISRSYETNRTEKGIYQDTENYRYYIGIAIKNCLAVQCSAMIVVSNKRIHARWQTGAYRYRAIQNNYSVNNETIEIRRKAIVNNENPFENDEAEAKTLDPIPTLNNSIEKKNNVSSSVTTDGKIKILVLYDSTTDDIEAEMAADFNFWEVERNLKNSNIYPNNDSNRLYNLQIASAINGQIGILPLPSHICGGSTACNDMSLQLDQISDDQLINNYRITFDADLVHLYRREPSSTHYGLAYKPKTYGFGDPAKNSSWVNLAFAVSSIDEHVSAHEVGHNLGAGHHPFDDPYTDIPQRAFGMQYTNSSYCSSSYTDAFVTVMTYSIHNTCQKLYGDIDYPSPCNSEVSERSYCWTGAFYSSLASYWFSNYENTRGQWVQAGSNVEDNAGFIRNQIPYISRYAENLTALLPTANLHHINNPIVGETFCVTPTDFSWNGDWSYIRAYYWHVSDVNGKYHEWMAADPNQKYCFPVDNAGQIKVNFDVYLWDGRIGRSEVILNSASSTAPSTPHLSLTGSTKTTLKFSYYKPQGSLVYYSIQVQNINTNNVYDLISYDQSGLYYDTYQWNYPTEGHYKARIKACISATSCSDFSEWSAIKDTNDKGCIGKGCPLPPPCPTGKICEW